MYDVVPQTQYDNDGELAFSVNGVFDHARISRADIVAETLTWGGSRRALALIDETLEKVREVARTEVPRPSAEPSMQDEVLRFTQNLLDGRRAGENAKARPQT